MAGFEELYWKHVQSVFRFALGCVGRRDLAEDLTSEAFLALYRNLDRIDETQLPAWLVTVVRNRARDHWRRQAVEQRYLETWVESTATGSSRLTGWILEGANLKPVHRTCVILRYVHGMTRAEISAKTGLTEMQVKGCLQYALKQLRAATGPQAVLPVRSP